MSEGPMCLLEGTMTGPFCREAKSEPSEQKLISMWGIMPSLISQTSVIFHDSHHCTSKDGFLPLGCIGWHSTRCGSQVGHLLPEKQCCCSASWALVPPEISCCLWQIWSPNVLASPNTRVFQLIKSNTGWTSLPPLQFLEVGGKMCHILRMAEEYFLKS